jgi:sugar phosphate isomerase/epimerase
MYISTEIQSYRAYGDDKQVIKMLKDAGFTAYDFSMFNQTWLGTCDILASDDYLEKAKEFRAYADEIGLPCNQAHAPFPTCLAEGRGPEGFDIAAYNAKAHEQIIRAIQVAGVLGAKIIVVHPCNDYSAEQNAELYKSFEETARKAGIKIAVENMWNWNHGEPTACAAACSHHDDFKAHMDLLPSDVFVACLDIGHAEMAGLDTTAVQMIERLGSHLQALHIHDNDCLHDNHALPYTMKIQFAPILEALKKIGYSGDVTMEAEYAKRFPIELYPHAAKMMAEVGNYMRNQLLEK